MKKVVLSALLAFGLCLGLAAAPDANAPAGKSGKPAAAVSAKAKKKAAKTVKAAKAAKAKAETQAKAEVKAVEEAPQTFDFGVIAAAAAVISAAGYAITRKRK